MLCDTIPTEMWNKSHLTPEMTDECNENTELQPNESERVGVTEGIWLSSCLYLAGKDDWEVGVSLKAHPQMGGDPKL